MTELNYRLSFVAPVSVFAGHSIAGLVDRTVVRNHDGTPYIPGSTVKGRLRFFAERVALSLDDNTISDGPKLWHGNHPAQPHCKQADKACMVCRLFGNPAISANMAVSDALLTKEIADRLATQRKTTGNPVLRGDATIQPGIALSRSRRCALPDHLFFDETIEKLEFNGSLAFSTPVSSDAKNFLKLAGNLVDALGARKAAGRGRLENGIEIGGGQ